MNQYDDATYPSYDAWPAPSASPNGTEDGPCSSYSYIYAASRTEYAA